MPAVLDPELQNDDPLTGTFFHYFPRRRTCFDLMEAGLGKIKRAT